MLPERLTRNDIDQCLGMSAIKRTEWLIKEHKAGRKRQFTWQRGNRESQAQCQRELVSRATRESRLGQILTRGRFPHPQLKAPPTDTSFFRIGHQAYIAVAPAGEQWYQLLYVV